MATRSRPVVVAGRFTERERRMIDAAASVSGLTLSDIVRESVLPAVRSRLREVAESESAGKGS